MYVISFRQRSMSSSYRQFGSVGLAGTVRTECRLKSVLVYRIIVSIPSVAVPFVTAYLFSFITFGHNNQLVIDKIGHPLCVVKRTAYQRRPPKAFHKELYTKLSQQIITGEIVGVIVGQFATLYLHLVAAFPDIVIIFQGIPVGQLITGAHASLHIQQVHFCKAQHRCAETGVPGNSDIIRVFSTTHYLFLEGNFSVRF